MILSLLSSRYVLGAASVGTFAYLYIAEASMYLNHVAEALAAVAGG